MNTAFGVERDLTWGNEKILHLTHVAQSQDYLGRVKVSRYRRRVRIAF